MKVYKVPAVRVSTTQSTIGVVLAITLTSVLSVIFAGTVLMLLAITVLSFAVGLFSGVGAIVYAQRHPMVSWDLLEEAEKRAKQSEQVIHHTVINQNISGGAGNGATGTLQITRPRNRNSDKPC